MPRKTPQDALPDPIKEITLPSGKKRYRFVIDVGRKPDGGRRQLTITRKTITEARTEYGRLLSAKESGTLIVPNKITVGQWIDQWLKLKEEDVEVTTLNSYVTTLKPAKKQLGHIRLQQLTEEDVVAWRDWLLTEGRVRPRNGRKGLSTTTADMALGRLKEVLNRAVTKRLVALNVAQHVSISSKARRADRRARPKVKPWNTEEVRAFIAGAATHRLFAAFLLSLMGLRPAEVCGLRWSDIDFETRVLVVDNTRTMINNNETIEKDTKSESSDRDLPLPTLLFDALKRFRALQAAQKLALGQDYEESGYVVVDEIGQPLTVRLLRVETKKVMGALGMRLVRLYDARASCLTFLANQGVPRHILARWAGHSNPKTTEQFYIKPDVEDLRAAAEVWGGLDGGTS
ncbi:tyrosine-type recombinase/integrase [Streptomyces griseorubiginosus]|uniref:tyrosine-type recombinase/integrase n=1 Tax=Streptomyces griseorubiginosus TaxID=67304 RepID=UPI00362565E6